LGHWQNELLILRQSALITRPGGIGTLGKKRDQAMNLLKVASHFSSELALGIRQFGAECDLASWVSQRHSPSQCQRRLPLRWVQLNHTDE
jgi:hypothetical protein